jgi:hypothetical protein
MHAHAIGPGLDEDGRKGVGILDHEMMIQFDVGKAPEGFSNRRAYRKIRHKMSIHDIHMQHLDTGCFHAADVFTQTREIGSEYGWKNLQHEVLKTNHDPLTATTVRHQPLFAASSRHSFDVSMRRYFWITSILPVTTSSGI